MELRDLSPAIVTILLVGLVLGIGLYVLTEFRENVATEYTGSDNNVNLTLSAGTTTLTDASKDDYALSSMSVINGSGTTIPSTQYSYTTAGVVTWPEALYNGSLAYYTAGDDTVNISSTYTYDAPGSAEEAVGDTVDGAGNFSEWLAVLVVVIAAAVVLGIVLKSFQNPREA